ncbi:MAG: ATP-grasp domain-containing protein [Nocardioidaceae bacterium]
MAKANIFVLGLDDLNLETLQDLPGAEDYRYHRLLDAEELVGTEDINLTELLEKAQQLLDGFDGRIDAVVGYWDFPVSSMVPLLCRRLGLPGANLEAVVKCEHKYWSRLEQQKAIDEHPRFGIVDLDDEHPTVPEGLRFPLWLKPVKSASSELAFKVKDQQEFEEAAEAIADGVDKVGKPFEFVLDQLDLPQEIAEVGGRACLAEEEVSGHQVTVEGYCLDEQIHLYGIVGSPTYPGSTSFLRFQYPTSLPQEVTDRLEELSHRVIKQIGLTGGTFNIEYFWDPDTGEINLLEINPRHSQSHAILFENVDGWPNHHPMVRLGLGHDPELPRRQGKYAVAAKWFLRRFHDGLVSRAPTDDEVAQLEHQVSDAKINIIAQEGQRLSDMPAQDSYSYKLADIFVGADDQEQLQSTYQRCVDALRFEFDD